MSLSLSRLVVDAMNHTISSISRCSHSQSTPQVEHRQSLTNRPLRKAPALCRLLRPSQHHGGPSRISPPWPSPHSPASRAQIAGPSVPDPVRTTAGRVRSCIAPRPRWSFGRVARYDIGHTPSADPDPLACLVSLPGSRPSSCLALSSRLFSTAAAIISGLIRSASVSCLRGISRTLGAGPIRFRFFSSARSRTVASTLGAPEISPGFGFPPSGFGSGAGGYSLGNPSG